MLHHLLLEYRTSLPLTCYFNRSRSPKKERVEKERRRSRYAHLPQNGHTHPSRHTHRHTQTHIATCLLKNINAPNGTSKGLGRRRKIRWRKIAVVLGIVNPCSGTLTSSHSYAPIHDMFKDIRKTESTFKRSRPPKNLPLTPMHPFKKFSKIYVKLNPLSKDLVRRRKIRWRKTVAVLGILNPLAKVLSTKTAMHTPTYVL